MGKIAFTKSKMKLNFKKEKPTVFKIQQVNYGVVDAETLIDDVAESCGLNRAMTKAALEGIVSRVCRYIGMGHAVQLGELGTVKPYFTAKTQETAEELSADNVRNKKIRFYPGSRLQKVVKNISISEYDLADGTILDSEEETDTETPDMGGDEQGGTEMD
jgi:predicted histone-like DNA-binding protein